MKKTKVKILMAMADKIHSMDISQREAARIFGTTQKRIWEIMSIKHNSFSLEKLLDYAIRLGIKVSFDEGFVRLGGRHYR